MNKNQEPIEPLGVSCLSFFSLSLWLGWMSRPERVRGGGSSEENGLTTNPKRCVLFDFCGGSSPLQLSHSSAAFFSI